ncbi:hypothetical protein CVT25_010381 [Psilocybe cyanescens]|uniref:Uncharacterized protein n=1 Tax=Psilocybe cyanescens TaxID=93625 RepID=A0A409XP70_PSICY|nr:hypothetical protein CVT25_010381 [Psilocybe cyanescens]
MPPKDSSCNRNAEDLKTQGNELFHQKQYQPAHRKYTEAIKADPANAVYYANRAACSLASKEYLDAAADAIKATELDPNYAKAWSRLATASHQLTSYGKSVNAWETALKCLPPLEQSSETDKKLRAQFTAGLAEAQKEKDTPIMQNETMRHVPAGQQMPWHRAAAMESELIAQQKVSSEFKEGVTSMKKLEKTITADGKSRYMGKAGTLVHISNAVMRDSRVFHFDSSDWIIKYNEQVIFEAELHKAWVHGGAKTIKEEAPKRLKREGWHKVRPALSTTIRAWLMCGVLSKVTGKYATSIEYYSRTLDVLEWGARTWQKVSAADRGVIFSKTFIRGARRMKLAAMHSCVMNKVQGVDITSDEMADFARELIAETDANPPDAADEPLDIGFAGSFWMYPKGDALSVLAWHYMQLGHNSTTSEGAQAAYSQSAECYIQAAQSYPLDEEQTIVFYKVALEAYWFSPQGKKLEDMIPLFFLISEQLPHVTKIWEHSEDAIGRDAQLMQALNFEKRCEDALKCGKIALDMLVKPKEIEHKTKWKGNFVYI